MRKRIWELVQDKNTNYWADRIISQIQYACKLSKINNNLLDNCIREIEDSLIKKYREDGAITKETALKTEEMLSILSKDAKQFKMIFAAHAHIDMNWMWGWHETVSIVLDTLRTMLRLMNDYPDFKFSQSQAAIYKIVEQYDLEMLEEIKKRVREGRWEVTASTWVETDKNIPNGESLARHILYTKKYLSKLFDIDPQKLNMDFEPDTFGHNANVPEILSKGGVKYFYHCRGYEGHNFYKWKSPAGNSIIAYLEPYWYNGFNIDSYPALYVPEFCSKHGIDTMLKVYGVGDHGGGPTRRDIERIMDMSTWPVFPDIRFGTFTEYFGIIEQNADKLPEVTGELNFIFDGCFTSQSRIKLGNKVSENLLNEAETFCSMSSLVTKDRYPSKEFEEAWRDVLFNQFHDIIPGSGVTETREYSMGLYQNVIACANTKKSLAFRKIASKIDTSELKIEPEKISDTISEGAGVGFGTESFKISQSSSGSGQTRIFHFFNSSMHEREEVVEVILWNWFGDADLIVFTDKDGKIAEHAITETGYSQYYHHDYMKLLVKVKVPACGYSTYLMTQGECLEFKTPPRDSAILQKLEELVLENKKLRVVFDPKSAAILSMVDKETGAEMVETSGQAGVFRLINEDDIKDMSSWIVGRYKKIQNLGIVTSINKVTPKGADIREGIYYEIQGDNASLKVSISLDRDSSLLKYDVFCDWHELGTRPTDTPQLNFFLPLAAEYSKYKYDIPFGTIEREGLDMDVPANNWVLGLPGCNNKKGMMMITTAKHGFRCMNNTMAVTLLRSSTRPDLYPEVGEHRFSFAIGAVDASSSNKELIESAYDYNHSLNVLSGENSHKGTLKLSDSFMSLEEGSVEVSAVKMAEMDPEGKLVIRVYETDGNSSKVSLKLFEAPVKAYFADVNENLINSDNSVTISGNILYFEIKPYNMETLILEF